MLLSAGLDSSACASAEVDVTSTGVGDSSSFTFSEPFGAVAFAIGGRWRAGNAGEDETSTADEDATSEREGRRVAIAYSRQLSDRNGHSISKHEGGGSSGRWTRTVHGRDLVDQRRKIQGIWDTWYRFLLNIDKRETMASNDRKERAEGVGG